MTKHDAVTAFFQPKAEELAGQYLEFNYSDDYSGISLVTNYSDKLLKKYLWGSEKEYGFSIMNCAAVFDRYGRSEPHGDEFRPGFHGLAGRAE